MKKVEERPLRTIALAVAGFAALMIALPDWARLEVAAFAAMIAVLAYAVDPAVRSALRFDSRSRASGARKAPAKPPAARRAAT